MRQLGNPVQDHDFLQVALGAQMNPVSWRSDRPVVDISVICANFNNARFLPTFFFSLAASTAYPREIILVDDGSTDNSKEVLAFYASRIARLRVIYLQTNRGFGNALNQAIDAATSTYLMRMDPDDVFTPSRIALQWAKITTGALDFVGSNALIFNDLDGRIVTRTNFPLASEDIRDRYRKGEHGLLHPTVLGRRTLFSQLRYFQQHVPAEDYDIFSRATAMGCTFENLAEPLIYYRAHASSSSTRLKYSLIERTFALRDSIFGTRTPHVSRLRYYLFIYSYRRYLFAVNRGLRLMWGCAAALMAPDRLIRRFL